MILDYIFITSIISTCQMGLFMVVAIIVTRWSHFIAICWQVPSCCSMKGHVLNYFSQANIIYGDCFFLSFYVLWKTEFHVVHIRLPALIRSILNIMDTVNCGGLYIQPQRQFYEMCLRVY